MTARRRKAIIRALVYAAQHHRTFGRAQKTAIYYLRGIDIEATPAELAEVAELSLEDALFPPPAPRRDRKLEKLAREFAPGTFSFQVTGAPQRTDPAYALEDGTVGTEGQKQVGFFVAPEDGGTWLVAVRQ